MKKRNPLPPVTQYGPPPPLFDHQRQSVDFMFKNPCALDFSDPGCVSADTEFLTPTGWKRIDEYNGDELVAQFEPTTRSISWVIPERYVKAPCSQMIAIAPVRGTSQRLSAEHRVLYYKPDGTHAECSAMQFMQDLYTLGANRLHRKFATTFKVEGRLGMSGTDAQLRVMVAVIADGSFSSPTATRVGIRLKKQRKIERLRELLQTANIQYVERTCGGNPEFQVFRFDAPWNEKTFSPNWWAASQAQLYIIADELPRWDGSERKANGTSFCSTIAESSNFAQYAFAATGNTAALKFRPRKDGKTPTYDVSVARGIEYVGPGRKTSVTIVDNPEGFKYCFQVPTTYWLARHNGYIFATGNTGKTRVQIELFNARRRRGGKCALVIAPKSLLRSAWEEDFNKFAPGMRVSVATAANREEAFNDTADVYVTNTDAAKWLAKQKPKFFEKFDTLIIDEVSAFKHHTSQRSKAMNKIKKHFDFRYALTGTPNSNAMTDIWHQVLLIDDGVRLGKSFYNFRSAICVPQQIGPQPNMVKWVERPGSEQAVAAMLTGLIVRHKFEECIDIPENFRTTVPYFLSPKQQRVYNTMEKVALSSVDGKTITAVNAAGVMTKLMQIASGASYNTDDDYSVVDEGRYELIADLVQARDNSVVFFNWKHQKAELIKEFIKQGITYTVIDGSVTDRARAEAVDHFQKGFYKVLLAHPQSAAHGLTLTRGTSTIWASPTYNLEHFTQGNRRIYRAGQLQRTETVVIVAAGTIEEKVMSKLGDKDAKQSDVLNIVKEMFQEDNPV